MGGDVCRTCLGTTRLRPLFPRSRPAYVVRDALRLCTGVQIEKDDGLSQKICKNCTDTVTLAVCFRQQSQATEKKLLELQNTIRVYRRICFNNNDELKLLTDVKEEKYLIPVKEEENYDVEVKTEMKVEHVDVEDEENSALLIHFPNDVIEVTAISKLDDLIDSLLCELNKTEVKDEEPRFLKDMDGNTKPENDAIPFEDLPNFDNNEDFLSFEESDAAKIEESEIVDTTVKPNKTKLTRLDLIDGPPNKHGPNRCRLCKKVSPNLKAFYKHLNSKHFGNKKAILCEFCAMRFTDSQKLLRHCRAKHGLERDDSFPCSHCPYRALDKEQLDVHERRVHTKERPFVCDNCGAGFFSKRVLVQHSRNHGDTKPFQCDKCPSKFKTRQRLCGHTLKIHLRRFTYACPLCDKRLSKSPYIRRHMLREHGVPLEKQGRLNKVYLHQ